MLNDMNRSTVKPQPNGEACSTVPQATSCADPVAPKQDSGSSSKILSSMNRIAPWAHKGGLAVLDQGLISGSNFIISILLARWLMPDQYGAYAVAFGIYVMLSLIYQSLVLEPMGVFGGSVFHSNLRGYLRSLVWIHITLSVMLCSAFALSWAVAHHLNAGSAMSGALAGVAIASPCLMLFSLARRTFYVELSPAPAAAGAFVYSTLVLLGLYVVYKHALLSPFVALLILAVSGLVTGIVLMFALRSNLSATGPAPALHHTWHRHWRYGRWALASCIAGWLPSYIYYPLLSSFSGMAQSGQLKALMNLTMPFEQTKGALMMLVLPFAARVSHQDGTAGARLLARRLTLLSLVLATAYWAVIIPLRKPVFHLLYSDRYLEVAYLLPALALGQIFWSATFGPSVALRAMELPGSVFIALGCATAGSLLIGVPATWAFGLKGAVWGSNAADIFSFIALLFVLQRQLATYGSNDFPSGSRWLGAEREVSPRLQLGISEEA